MVGSKSLSGSVSLNLQVSKLYVSVHAMPICRYSDSSDSHSCRSVTRSALLIAFERNNCVRQLCNRSTSSQLSKCNSCSLFMVIICLVRLRWETRNSVIPVRSTSERSLVIVWSIISLIAIQATKQDGKMIKEDQLAVETTSEILDTIINDIGIIATKAIKQTNSS